MFKKIINDCMWGVIVGDALGLPVQFEGRDARVKEPVTGMIGHRCFDMPAGSWSDDSSMSLCTLDSLSEGYNPEDIMNKFEQWYYDGRYTPAGYAYDVGSTCAAAIGNYHHSHDIKTCGLQKASNNGNGSLMRIMPMVLYQYFSVNPLKNRFMDKVLDPIHEVSALTHAHPVSMIGCGIYTFMVSAILNFKHEAHEYKNIEYALQVAMNDVVDYYKRFGNSVLKYKRIFNISRFKHLKESDIKSSGYVVDTLEAALWCFLNSKDYSDCVLRAVNLGGDTDSIAAVAGGLAGAYYGFESIPEDWLSCIAKRDEVNEVIGKFTGKIRTFIKDVYSCKCQYLEDASIESLITLLKVMSKSFIYIPATVKLSDKDAETITDDPTCGGTFELHDDMRLFPDIIKDHDNKKWFPMFCDKCEVPEEYGKRFSWVNMPVIDCIDLAHRVDGLEGIVLDPFSKNVTLPFSIADKVIEIYE